MVETIDLHFSKRVLVELTTANMSKMKHIFDDNFRDREEKTTSFAETNCAADVNM